MKFQSLSLFIILSLLVLSRVEGFIGYVNCQNSVQIVDTVTETSLGSISLEVGSGHSVITADGSKIFVAMFNSGSVGVIDTYTNTVITTIPVQPGSQQLVLTPNEAKLYVVNRNGNTVSVIDAVANSLITTISIINPFGIACNPAGTQVYVTSGTATGLVNVIDTTTDTIINTINIGSFPENVIFVDRGVPPLKAYVVRTVNTANNLVVINADTGSISTTISVGLSPQYLQASLDQSKVYVANTGSSFLSVINTATDTTLPQVTLPSAGSRILGLTPNGQKLYALALSISKIYSVNTTTDTLISTISDAVNPAGIAITPDNVKAVVGDAGPSQVDFIDVATDAVTTKLTVGDATPSFVLLNVVPAVLSLSPSAGPLGGGTILVIGGFNFTGATSVFFGATSAAFTVNSDSTITATSPPGVGSVNVSVVTPFGTSLAVPASTFTYFAQPTILGLSPNSGPESGGTSVTITGTNFTGTTSVTFGAAVATSFTIDSATQITAVSPPGTGIVNVRVTNPGGASPITPADQFTYAPAPAVLGISPTSGPAAGGTSVTITGTNLTGATSVTFGATPATSFIVDSATQITAISPPGSGTVDVRVTTAGGISPITAADRFTYLVPVPAVLGLSPNSGSTSGGTTVTITGTGFSGATNVTFGGRAATSFTVNSATQITAISPAGTGTVDVRVTTSGGTSPITGSDRFTYVTSVTPVAPKTFVGTIRRNRFLNRTEIVLEAIWSASTSLNGSFYRIYLQDRVVATIASTAPRIFEKLLSSADQATQFSITAVSADGLESPHKAITIVGG